VRQVVLPTLVISQQIIDLGVLGHLDLLHLFLLVVEAEGQVKLLLHHQNHLVVEDLVLLAVVHLLLFHLVVLQLDLGKFLLH
jgi:hypothetical protein